MPIHTTSLYWSMVHSRSHTWAPTCMTLTVIFTVFPVIRCMPRWELAFFMGRKNSWKRYLHIKRVVK